MKSLLIVFVGLSLTAIIACQYATHRPFEWNCKEPAPPVYPYKPTNIVHKPVAPQTTSIQPQPQPQPVPLKQPAIDPRLPIQGPGRWVPAYVRAYSAFNKLDHGHKYNDGWTAGPSRINLRTTTDPNKIYGFACDPAYLPHGTRIYVPGYWEKLQGNKVSIPTQMTMVNDTCGGIGKSKQEDLKGQAYYIEIRFLREREAFKWGINNGKGEDTLMMVYIYD